MSAGRSLDELARLLGGRVVGSPELMVSAVRSLEEAGPGDLAPFTDRRFRAQARASRAAALLVIESLADEAVLSGAGDPAASERPLLVVADSPPALAALLSLFHPPRLPPPGVHPTAVVGAGAEIDPSASLGPFVVVGEGCRVGADCVIEAHTVLGRDCRLGIGVRLHPHVVLYDRVELQDRVEVHSGTVLGADGFGYFFAGGEHRKIPQVGRVVVEEDVEIGANSAVDRATLGATRLGAGSKVDNLVQVGHNVRVGKSCVLCGQAGVAGSSRLADGVVVGGQAGISDHLELGPGVQVAGGSAVLRSIPAGAQGGVPAIDLREFRRLAVVLPRLGEALRRLRRVEQQLAGEGGSEGKPPGPEKRSG